LLGYGLAEGIIGRILPQPRAGATTVFNHGAPHSRAGLVPALAQAGRVWRAIQKRLPVEGGVRARDRNRKNNETRETRDGMMEFRSLRV
jgi:hypothetical protein